MKDSYVLFRSVHDALMAFPAEHTKEALRIIGAYAMDGVLPENHEGIAYGMFLSVKPLIDKTVAKSNARAASGKAGGEANGSKHEANESKREANGSKPEANTKQTEAYKGEMRKEKDITVGCKQPMSGKAQQTAAEYPYKAICDQLNKFAGTAFKDKSKDTRKHIKARFEDGFTLEDFYTVIEKKCAEWMGTDMEKYLRPSTLFGSKFEAYLNQAAKPTKQDHAKGQYDDYEHDWTDHLSTV